MTTASETPDPMAALDPLLGEEYFVEQRRRFTGEREVDDRPEPPALPWSVRRRLQDRLLAPLGPEIEI